MTQSHLAGRHVGHDRLRTLLAELPPDPPGPRPDAVLLTATRSGDVDAYAELIRRHEPAARLLLASLPREALAGDALPGDALADDAVPTAEDRLRAAGDQVLATVHAGTGPRAAFRPFFLRAVLRVSTSTTLEAGNGLRRSGSEQDPAGPAGPADPAYTALAYLPESVLTVLWHSAVEHDHPERLAVVLGTKAAEAAVAGYRAEAAFRRVYVRRLLDELEDTPAQCREILEALGRHTFDGLYDEEAGLVTDHLTTCPTCTDLHQRLVAADAALPERLAGLVLGPHAPGYLAALRRTGAPAFVLVGPATRPHGPQQATPSWTERLASSGRQLWAGRGVLRGRTAGIAAMGALAAASVATLAWGTVAMIGSTTPVTDADRARVPGSRAGDTAAEGPPEDDWMGFVQDSPRAPETGVVLPAVPPTAAVTAEAARPAARSDAVIDRPATQRTKPTVTDGPLPTAPAPTPRRTATPAPVPPAPNPQPTRTRTSTPEPPPPGHSSPPPTSEPSPPAPPPAPEPPPPTPDPSPPPTTDPTPPPAPGSTPTTPPPSQT
ncbi:hypothetical protein [Actinopolymorpha rutila]|uniref:Zinc-finger n=1 Tax=Actinopolymorpha rutila TaxID=446787 RepID=A0A852ZIM5_9ACTN|nr:hypothetical protein [Actinopolymorpha rutila]NYH88166.1 hypothetical protein [Actinopolymorpha rutila]